MFYVYIYKHPITKQPFYVGKGTRGRAWIHLDPRKRRNCHFHNTITKLEQELQSAPLVEIVQDNLSEEEAYSLEISLIKQFGRIYYDEGGILTNVDPGGKGPTQLTRKLISESLLNRSRSAEHCANLSRARNRQQIPPKTKLWKIKSPEGNIFEVLNLKKFCLERGLAYDQIKQNVKSNKPVARGISAGWKAISAERYLA